MANGKLMTGSICLSDMIASAKEKHTAFSKSEKNGKIYCNIQIWLNEEPDQYGNDAGIKLNPKKDSSDKGFFIGNAKYVKPKEPAAKVQEDWSRPESPAELPSDDDLSF